MNGKAKNKIFSIIIMLMLVISAGIMIKTKPEETNISENFDEEESSKQAVGMTEEEKAEEKELYKKQEQLLSQMLSADYNREYHMGEYKNYKNSVEINQDFITEQLSFKQHLCLSEIEFVRYEEIKDLSQYFCEGLRFDENGIAGNYEIYGFLSGLYSEFCNGMINEDGTFNSVNLVQKPTYNTYVDGDKVHREYGKETVLYDQELMAVKLTVKVRNLSFYENDIYLNSIIEVWNLIHMDDEKLYIKESVISSDYYPSNVITYIDMKDKFVIRDGVPDADGILLGAREEYVGDIIFVFLKSDFENMYLSINEGQNCDELNFNAVDVHLISFETLKKLENNE